MIKVDFICYIISFLVPTRIWKEIFSNHFVHHVMKLLGAQYYVKAACQVMHYSLLAKTNYYAPKTLEYYTIFAILTLWGPLSGTLYKVLEHGSQNWAKYFVTQLKSSVPAWIMNGIFIMLAWTHFDKIEPYTKHYLGIAYDQETSLRLFSHIYMIVVTALIILNSKKSKK